MWRAVNALETQPAAGRIWQSTWRNSGPGDEISCPAAPGLVMAGPHSEGTLLNGRMVRSCLIELLPVAVARHKEEPGAHAEPKPPLALGTRDSKPIPIRDSRALAQGP